jgi:hypothetical protein
MMTFGGEAFRIENQLFVELGRFDYLRYASQTRFLELFVVHLISKAIHSSTHQLNDRQIVACPKAKPATNIPNTRKGWALA